MNNSGEVFVKNRVLAIIKQIEQSKSVAFADPACAAQHIADVYGQTFTSCLECKRCAYALLQLTNYDSFQVLVSLLKSQTVYCVDALAGSHDPIAITPFANTSSTASMPKDLTISSFLDRKIIMKR